MSHMKEISIRELHRRTGVWVRNTRKYGPIVVSDRNIPVAKLIPIENSPVVNVFENWKPLKRFAKALDKPVGGTPAEDIIGQDRDR
jgi:prevent-host-death family protein